MSARGKYAVGQTPGILASETSRHGSRAKDERPFGSGRTLSNTVLRFSREEPQSNIHIFTFRSISPSQVTITRRLDDRLIP